MDMEPARKSRSKAKTIAATAQIGKNGLTVHIINHLKEQLKARKLIKIKVLASAQPGDRREYARKLASILGARVIDTIGHVIVLEESSAARDARR